MIRLTFLLLSALLSLATSPANSYAEEVFRWIDSDGKVNYGSKAPRNAKELRPVDEKSFSKYSHDRVLRGHGILAEPNPEELLNQEQAAAWEVDKAEGSETLVPITQATPEGTTEATKTASASSITSATGDKLAAPSTTLTTTTLVSEQLQEDPSPGALEKE